MINHSFLLKLVKQVQLLVLQFGCVGSDAHVPAESCGLVSLGAYLFDSKGHCGEERLSRVERKGHFELVPHLLALQQIVINPVNRFVIVQIRRIPESELAVGYDLARRVS